MTALIITYILIGLLCSIGVYRSWNMLYIELKMDVYPELGIIDMFAAMTLLIGWPLFFMKKSTREDVYIGWSC